jgi:hypothetical protein
MEISSSVNGFYLAYKASSCIFSVNIYLDGLESDLREPGMCCVHVMGS